MSELLPEYEIDVEAVSYDNIKEITEWAKQVNIQSNFASEPLFSDDTDENVLIMLGSVTCALIVLADGMVEVCDRLDKLQGRLVEVAGTR